MRDYNVRIEFPSRRNINSANGDGNTVLVTGAPENVDQACDYLISKANEFVSLIFLFFFIETFYSCQSTCVILSN